jgi:hypothetical protein
MTGDERKGNWIGWNGIMAIYLGWLASNGWMYKHEALG